VLDMPGRLEPPVNAFAVNQLVQCLQTATRAERAGADEIVAASLCRDIGKVVTDVNHHPAIAADILAPFVRPDVAWMIRVHQDFQGRHYYGYFGKDPQARQLYRERIGGAVRRRMGPGVVRKIFGSPRYA
jgi:hypothetical protein